MRMCHRHATLGWFSSTVTMSQSSHPASFPRSTNLLSSFSAIILQLSGTHPPPCCCLMNRTHQQTGLQGMTKKPPSILLQSGTNNTSNKSLSSLVLPPGKENKDHRWLGFFSPPFNVIIIRKVTKTHWGIEIFKVSKSEGFKINFILTAHYKLL